ncbi:hypothetical protein ARMGADRAFT_964080 [Armillaria gallica]|uniref:Glycosyltransferase family 69 protein n=1 Tax=Armillaria gallica TaxID=47427 RepID=A0A2H3DJI4_ARMGA|nr:hypothetical protein ARMGADRAFT_964080 [Armillaria gallica]
MRLLWAFWTFFSTLRQISPYAIPTFLFAFIYNQVYLYWLATVGMGSWAPAWPANRTRLVFLMVSIPTWGLVMLIWTVGFTVLKSVWARRTSRGEFYEAIELDPEPHTNRNFRRGYVQYRWHLSVLLYLSLFICGLFMLSTRELPGDVRFKADIQAAIKSPRPEGHGNGEKVFIGAMFYNNEQVVPYWCDEVIKLIKYLGTDNVFVSTVESNSGDKTPALLEQFSSKLTALKIQHRILNHDTSITRPESMDTAPPRIQFLAAVRNKVLEPLVANGSYDRVIFSNDVFIESETILELLKTRDGDYDMACGIDLSYWGMYDAWVLRDRLGRLVSSLWPYFLEDAGMQAVMKDEPAPVFTCWNGIVSFRPDPFLPVNLRVSGRLSTSPLSKPLPSSHPSFGQPADLSPAQTPPMSFRASVEGECFSSESFLMPYDMRRRFEMNNIYLNPRVIVSYEWNFYVWYKWVLRHWMVKWWIENVENGSMMHLGKMVVGEAKNIWTWDGGECQPWW